MSWRWWIRLLIAVTILPLLAVGYDRSRWFYWVGKTDLEIEFVVTDAETCEPIPGALIDVHSIIGYGHTEHPDENFGLVTDDDGSAHKVCLRSKSTGKSSGLGFSSTFAAYMPAWLLQVVADGYEPSQMVQLDEFGGESHLKAERTGPGKLKVLVPVSLHKKHE